MIISFEGKKSARWVSWYAWRPVKLIDQRWAWLQQIERTSYRHNHQIPINAPFSVGGWCFRLPEEDE